MIERKYHFETIEGKKKRVYEDTPTCEQGTQEELDQMKRNIERGYGYFQEIKEKENNDVGVTTTNAKEGEYLTIDMQDTQHRIYEVKDGEATLLPQEEAKKITNELNDLNLGQTHIIYKPNNLLKKLLLSLLLFTLGILLGYGLAYLLGLLIAR